MRATFALSNVLIIGVICFVPTRGNHIHQKHMSHQDPDDSGKFTEPGLVTHIIHLVIPVAQTGDGANSHSLHNAREPVRKEIQDLLNFGVAFEVDAERKRGSKFMHA